MGAATLLIRKIIDPFYLYYLCFFCVYILLPYIITTVQWKTKWSCGTIFRKGRKDNRFVISPEEVLCVVTTFLWVCCELTFIFSQSDKKLGIDSLVQLKHLLEGMLLGHAIILNIQSTKFLMMLEAHPGTV